MQDPRRRPEDPAANDAAPKGTTMKTHDLASVLAAALLAATGVAHADSMPSAAPAPQSTPSRAEVLAERALWQRAGLDALEAGEAGADVFSARYRDAHAAYLAQRHSPAFAQLVERIARERGESVRIAGQ
jgi:hypothetical protein